MSCVLVGAGLLHPTTDVEDTDPGRAHDPTPHVCTTKVCEETYLFLQQCDSSKLFSRAETKHRKECKNILEPDSQQRL